MIVEAQVIINGSREATWRTIAAIERGAEIVRGIEGIEITGRPAQGLIGLRWRETRILFGKPETVEKWITDASDGEFYATRAEAQGFVHTSTMRISGDDGALTLASVHESRPVGIKSRLMAIPMIFFKGAVRKAILQDLGDIKAAVERGAQSSSDA